MLARRPITAQDAFLKARHPGLPVVTYVNTSAAEGGDRRHLHSSNAVAAVESSI
jgi:quinolinate synthase